MDAAKAVKCHYEVLEVGREATDLEISIAFIEKLAVASNGDEVQDQAKQYDRLNYAYKTLSNKEDRDWYDKNIDVVLREGFEQDDDDFIVDLFPYFSSACFTGFNDEEKGFYTVYRGVFELVSTEELDSGCEEEIPSFGDSLSAYDDVVGPFYGFWEAYCTCKSFMWKDEYDSRRAGNRMVARMMERETKKVRTEAKQAWNQQVRALVDFVKLKDKRVQDWRTKQEAARKEKEATVAEKAFANHEKSKKHLTPVARSREELENEEELEEKQEDEGGADEEDIADEEIAAGSKQELQEEEAEEQEVPKSATFVANSKKHKDKCRNAHKQLTQVERLREEFEDEEKEQEVEEGADEEDIADEETEQPSIADEENKSPEENNRDNEDVELEMSNIMENVTVETTEEAEEQEDPNVASFVANSKRNAHLSCDSHDEIEPLEAQIEDQPDDETDTSTASKKVHREAKKGEIPVVENGAEKMDEPEARGSSGNASGKCSDNESNLPVWGLAVNVEANKEVANSTSQDSEVYQTTVPRLIPIFWCDVCKDFFLTQSTLADHRHTSAHLTPAKKLRQGLEKIKSEIEQEGKEVADQGKKAHEENNRETADVELEIIDSMETVTVRTTEEKDEPKVSSHVSNVEMGVYTEATFCCDFHDHVALNIEVAGETFEAPNPKRRKMINNENEMENNPADKGSDDDDLPTEHTATAKI